GGLGPLHLVLDRVERRPLAMRTIREDLWSNPSSREVLRKEVRAWVDLPRHPYVVRAALVEESQGLPRLALDYIAPDERGLNTLEGVLEKEPPELGVALRWAVQCCAALEHAFARGLRRHGNLKPSNILIGVDGAVRLTDLAMAEGMGTPTHMAPEGFDDPLGRARRRRRAERGVRVGRRALPDGLGRGAALPASALGRRPEPPLDRDARAPSRVELPPARFAARRRRRPVPPQGPRSPLSDVQGPARRPRGPPEARDGADAPPAHADRAGRLGIREPRLRPARPGR